ELGAVVAGVESGDAGDLVGITAERVAGVRVSGCLDAAGEPEPFIRVGLDNADDVAGRGHRVALDVGVRVVPVAFEHAGTCRRGVYDTVGAQAELFGGADDRPTVGVPDIGDRCAGRVRGDLAIDLAA